LLVGFGRDVLELAPRLPILQARRDELLFDPALNEELIDAQELLAQTLVIDIAYDGGQRHWEGLLNGKQASGRELAYKLAH
jgi:hypothetical protein